MSRGKLNKDLVGYLNNLYPSLGLVGKLIKEGHQNRATATRRILDAGFAGSTIAYDGLYGHATAVTGVAPALHDGFCTFGLDGSGQGQSTLDTKDELMYLTLEKPFLETKAGYKRGSATPTVEIDVLTFDLEATHGSFVVSYNGVDSPAPVAYNANLATVAAGIKAQLLLLGLPATITVAPVALTWVAGFTVTFTGVYGPATLGIDSTLLLDVMNAALTPTITPTPLGTTIDAMMYIGFCSANNIDFETATFYLGFKIYDDGTNIHLYIVSEDGTVTNSNTPTNITILEGVLYTFKIDISDSSDVKFYVDGKMCDCPRIDFSNLISGIQPCMQLQKLADDSDSEAGATYFRVESNR